MAPCQRLVPISTYGTQKSRTGIDLGSCFDLIAYIRSTFCNGCILSSLFSEAFWPGINFVLNRLLNSRSDMADIHVAFTSEHWGRGHGWFIKYQSVIPSIQTTWSTYHQWSAWLFFVSRIVGRIAVKNESESESLISTRVHRAAHPFVGRKCRNKMSLSLSLSLPRYWRGRAGRRPSPFQCVNLSVLINYPWPWPWCFLRGRFPSRMMAFPTFN